MNTINGIINERATVSTSRLRAAGSIQSLTNDQSTSGALAPDYLRVSRAITRLRPRRIARIIDNTAHTVDSPRLVRIADSIDLASPVAQ